MKIDVSVDIRNAQRGLQFAAKQFPFATARALTAVAATIQGAETKALPSIFDRPTPFTMKAFGIKPARKAALEAEVFAKRTQANYLAPSEFGTPQYLGKGKAIRDPADVPLNQYGNLPRNKIASLLKKKAYFLAVIHGQNGLWKRYIKRDGQGRKVHHVKLIVAFDAPRPVSTHLDFQKRARGVASMTIEREFHQALRQALDTAR